MTLNKNDFIEIEFTGKIQGSEDIFDSNIKKDVETAGLKTPIKPFIFALGQGMFLEGVDNFLVGKEVGKDYELKLSAENAFGIRDPKAIQLVPSQLFKQHQVTPMVGRVFNFDGKMGKILSVSGGRIRVDFNHPLAGKDVSYNLKVLRKVEDLNEKLDAFNEFLFKKKFKFEIKDKDLTLEVEKPLVQFVQLFADKFKELFDLNLKIKAIEVQIPKKE